MRSVIENLRQAEAILASIEHQRPKPNRTRYRPSAIERRIEKNLAEITERLNRLLGSN
jgi:hypothetical protein